MFEEVSEHYKIEKDEKKESMFPSFSKSKII